jgi:phosphopantetheinyl transferase
LKNPPKIKPNIEPNIERNEVHVWLMRLKKPDRAIARTALRVLLGRYLDIAPAKIEFAYGVHGKPELTLPAGLDFSVSHAGDLAAFAFTRDCQIGIDIEQIRPISEMLDVARRFFTSEEFDHLMSLPEDERVIGFYLCWTRREAYIKAIGSALSVPPDQLPPLQPSEWTVHPIEIANGYAATIIYRGSPRTSCFNLSKDPESLSI